MANLADAAEAAASLSMGCAGESTACEVSAIDAVECFSSTWAEGRRWEERGQNAREGQTDESR